MVNASRPIATVVAVAVAFSPEHHANAHVTPAEMTVPMPLRVVVNPSGEAAVEWRQRLPGEALPHRLPLVTHTREGTAISGMIFEFGSDGPFSPGAEAPFAVCFDDSQQKFVVRRQMMPVIFLHTTLPAGYRGVRQGSEWIAFDASCANVPSADEALLSSISRRTGAFRARASWNIDYAYSVEALDAAFGSTVRQDIEAAIWRCELRLQALLNASYGNHTHTVEFASSLPSNPAGAAAVTSPTVQGPGVNFFRASLAINNQFNGEPDIESDASLDVPSPIPFRRTVGGTPSASQLAVANALLESVQGTPSVPPATANTTCLIAPPFAPWDFNRQDGLAENSTDFEATLMHETLHALGFFSVGDALGLPPNVIAALDVFRFPDSVGNAVDMTENSTIRREIAPGQAAVFCSQPYIGNATGRAAAGAPDQFSHWNSVGTPIPPIGIMEVNATLFSDATGKFLSTLDAQQLDLLGWNLTPSTIPSVGVASLLAPTPGQLVATRTPTFSWSNASNDHYHLSVFKLLAGDERQRVVLATGLTGQELTIAPSLALEWGASYEWRVVGEVWTGFSDSATGTFSVKCPADVDDGSATGVPDGAVDIGDLVYFLTAFEAGSTTVDIDDGSGSGTPDNAVDISDLIFFLVRFESGC